MGVQPAKMKEGYLSWRRISNTETQYKKFKKVKIFLVTNHEQKILKIKKFFYYLCLMTASDILLKE